LLQRPLLVEEREGKVAAEVVGCIRFVEVDRQTLVLVYNPTEVGKVAVEDIQSCSLGWLFHVDLGTLNHHHLDRVEVVACRSF